MRQYHKILKAIDISSYRRYLQQMFITVGLLLFSLVSVSVHANPFATPDNFDAASCPTGHKKYTIANTASTAPSLNSWIAGERSRTFTFNESSGNKAFTINFPLLIDANNSDSTVPFYGSRNGVSSNAINLRHNSTQVQTDHSLELSVNRPVSKIGYKIQDLDSTTTGFFSRRTPYIEQVDVSANNGQLTFNNIFHSINPNRDIVTAKEGENCSTGQCTIDATWGYKPANTVVKLRHSNEKRETSGVHATGYSDFYFCLAPPKIIVNKLLDGSRVDGDDQFRIELRRTDNNDFVEAFTTTGSNDVVTDNTTTVTTLTEGVNYTVSEQIINGNLLDYQTTYTCSNATTGTDVVFSSGEMPVNADGTRRTFAINNVSYGDEITCNVTNTPSQYTFSGIVFNDNGGISSSTSTRQNISTTFTGNANYFNGIFDSSDNNIESGIGASGLQVRLTNCGSNGGTNIVGTTAQNIPESPPSGLLLGQYRFTVPASTIAALSSQKVCVVQVEPSNWEYSIDTTPNTREINLTNGLLDYKTESNGSRNLDFGEVKANNASLVLIKSQYVHTCSDSINFNSIPANPSPDSPTNGFSIQPVSDIDPGKCIAYRIEAYNRGHVDLQDIQITDKLQTEPVLSVFNLSRPLGVPDTVYNSSSPSPVYGQNGTIVSNKFNLVKPTTTSPTKATLFFNTKYGTTNNTNP